MWTQYFHCVFGEMKTQIFLNAFVLTGPKTSRQAGRGQAGDGVGVGGGGSSLMDGYRDKEGILAKTKEINSQFFMFYSFP